MRTRETAQSKPPWSIRLCRIGHPAGFVPQQGLLQSATHTSCAYCLSTPKKERVSFGPPHELRPAKIPMQAKKRVRRPRRELPADLTDLFIAPDDRPNDLDVIGGRGGGSNHHEGNKRYWRRILLERPGYKQLGKHDNVAKNEISEAIYMYILSTGGRFLQFDPKTQKWFNIPKKISLDKIKQALRDRYVPHFLKGEPRLATGVSLPAPSAPTEVEKVPSLPQHIPKSKGKIGLLLAAGALCLAGQVNPCDAYQTNANFGLSIPKRRGNSLSKTWIQNSDQVDSFQDEGLSERQNGVSVLLTVPMGMSLLSW